VIPAWSCCQEEASGQQIEPRPAKHLALEQLQPIDVPFDRALAPRQRDRGLDGGIVRAQPSGKAPEGQEGAGGRAGQPWFELGRLARADEGGEVLRERDGLCQFGRLRGQLCQLLVIRCCQPLRRPEDQPRRPARRERPPWRLRHRGQWLRTAPVLGG
jgi:hypothetical protein